MKVKKAVLMIMDPNTLKAALDDLEIDQEVKVDGLVFEREKV